ncbi:hypothetical protein BHM03_00048399 [Ensete ventricosum]|nr:hypothetical protein BHM03_00048399 [Ensete ventricosum]
MSEDECVVLVLVLEFWLFWTILLLAGKRTRVWLLKPGLGVCIQVTRPDSLGHQLGGGEPRRSPHAEIDFLSSIQELQPLKVCYDVPGGVAYPWSGDLIQLAIESGASLFCQCVLSLLGWLSGHRHLHQGRGGGGMCCPDMAPPMVKLAMNHFVLYIFFCVQEGSLGTFASVPFILPEEIEVIQSGLMHMGGRFISYASWWLKP